MQVFANAGVAIPFIAHQSVWTNPGSRSLRKVHLTNFQQWLQKLRFMLLPTTEHESDGGIHYLQHVSGSWFQIHRVTAQEPRIADPLELLRCIGGLG